MFFNKILQKLTKTQRPKRTAITMYPEGFERKVVKGEVGYKYFVRRGWRFEQLKRFNEQGIIEFESVTSFLPIPKVPQYVPMYAACFIFGYSDILKIVPFHPDTPYLFFGEEMFMTVRLLSHGFDLVGPTSSVLYHLWIRDYRKTYWEHDVATQRDRSIEKIKKIMTGKIDSKYGLGNQRSWTEIQEYLGIDFEKRFFIFFFFWFEYLKRIFTRPHQPWKLPKNFRKLIDEFCI